MTCNDKDMHAARKKFSELCCEGEGDSMTTLLRVLILGAILATADSQPSEKGIVLIDNV